jgi:hypothetical protein
MQADILEHDKENAKVKIKFAYKGIVITQNYDLKLVVPSTNVALARISMEFNEEVQQTLIDRIIAQVTAEIDAGILEVPPTEETT